MSTLSQWKYAALLAETVGEIGWHLKGWVRIPGEKGWEFDSDKDYWEAIDNLGKLGWEMMTSNDYFTADLGIQREFIWFKHKLPSEGPAGRM